MRSPYLDDDRAYPPLGLLYLKSYLNQYNIQVTLDDDFDFSDITKYEKYDLFGVSVMTPQREKSLEFLDFCKATYEGDVVIGGPHALHYKEDVVRENWDYIVCGDGFRSLLQIIEGVSDKRVYYDILTKEQWRNLPRPDRSSDQAIEVLSNYTYMLGGVKSTTMLTAIGCPERCTFCEDAQTAVRWSSLENIKGELDDIVNLGYGGVYIFDDLFAIALKMVRPICYEIQRRGLIYRCNGQARYFNEEFAKLLSSTGCHEIAFGVESGSQVILNNINKRTTVEQNYKFVELCKKYHIKCKAFLMIGLPGETYETIALTEKFIKEAELDDFQLSIYYPYKGTFIRDTIDARGKGAGIFFEGEGLGAYGTGGGNTESVVSTDELTSEQLLQERDRLVNTYRPTSHKQKWSFFDEHIYRRGSI
jgi:radical SAM superfamily enzyme YgiQ (UPF0313 family)